MFVCTQRSASFSFLITLDYGGRIIKEHIYSYIIVHLPVPFDNRGVIGEMYTP